MVCARENIPQLDDFKEIADRYGATLRLTRLRPSGRRADVWDELHPLPRQQREPYDWLVAHGEDVLTGDSFFHLAAYGESLPGLNLCGAGRVVCLIDPVGDVYACPFAIHATSWPQGLGWAIRQESALLLRHWWPLTLLGLRSRLVRRAVVTSLLVDIVAARIDDRRADPEPQTTEIE